MGLRCVVASDFHLEGMQKVLTNPLPYQLREIEKVYQYALSNSIQHLIVPGDLCHKPTMEDDTLLALITLLLKYDGDIETKYIAGNHDWESTKSTSLDILSAIADAGFFKSFKIFKQPTLEKLDGISIAFMPFPHTKIPKSSKPPLIFAHIETAGALGDNGRPLRSGHDDQLVRQPGDFIITGHLHKHQYLKQKRILYVGSLYQTNFGEDLPKGFLDVEVKYVNGKIRVDYLQIDTKPNFILETKVISSNEDWDSLDSGNHVRYKILVEEGLVVPKNISSKLQNIITIAGLNKKSKVVMGDIIESQIATNLPTFKITTGLKKYVKQLGLSEKQVKKAQFLAKEAANSLGLYK